MSSDPEATGRWIFTVPRLNFERAWTFGPATFQPAGVHAAELRDLRSSVDEAREFAVEMWQDSVDLAQGFEDCTVELRTRKSGEALELLREVLGVVRFLLRDVIYFNVESHRIGLPGDVDHAVVPFLLVRDDGSTGNGWSLRDSPTSFTCTEELLDRWDSDKSVQWLSTELARPETGRSVTGQRSMTAIAIADQAFLTGEASMKVLLAAMAVESMFAGVRQSDRTETLQIARRLAYLTCCSSEDDTSPLCPYVGGFKREKNVVTFAEGWVQRTGQWQCSAFLKVATPRDLEPYRPRRSLFSARNEVAHEGRTSLSLDDAKRLRFLADESLRAGIGWFAAEPGRGVAELDEEIDLALAARGKLTPEQASQAQKAEA